MASEKQFMANKQNALKSTGPRTENGKATTSKNAIKHGILSKEIYLDAGMQPDFNKLREGLYFQFKPQGELEDFLLDRIINCAWRLAILTRIESQIYQKESASSYIEKHQISQAFLSYTQNAMAHLNRYETNIERSLYRALEELKIVQGIRQSNHTGSMIIEMENGFVSQSDGS